jgi:hypothetical protein
MRVPPPDTELHAVLVDRDPGRRLSTTDCLLAYGLRTPLGPMVAVASDRGIALLEFVDRRANGRNRVAILVPCHRVVGADGSLTGYGGGLWRKRYLLDLEAAT